MLLRSASSPLLNCGRALATEPGGVHFAPPSPSPPARPLALCRAFSEGDLSPRLVTAKNDHGKPRATLSAASSASISVEEEEEEEQEHEEGFLGATVPMRQLLTSSGLDAAAARSAAAAAVLLDGVGSGGGGRKVCNGGRGGDRGDNHSRDADAYYRRMIEADPANSLLLANYAKFLKAEGDVVRAQEYCERAILVNPVDGEALALYAGLVWDTSQDAGRADAYFSRAVQAAPDDCYVLASYAGFLWDAEEEDEEDLDKPSPPPFLGAAQPPSFTAAS